MNEVICCRACGQPSCRGCNMFTLQKMLDKGKFDCLMDEKHSIMEDAEVTLKVCGFKVKTKTVTAEMNDRAAKRLNEIEKATMEGINIAFDVLEELDERTEAIQDE